jgi:hypothetical protein
MLAPSLRSRGIATVAALITAACASAGAPPSQAYPAMQGPSLLATGRVLDSEGIRRSGAHTAWDAIRLLRPGFSFQRTQNTGLMPPRGAPARIDDAALLLVIDGHRIRDLDALRALPAAEVVTIQLLTATEAAAYFGAGSREGAIIVRTRTSLRPM